VGEYRSTSVTNTPSSDTRAIPLWVPRGADPADPRPGKRERGLRGPASRQTSGRRRSTALSELPWIRPWLIPWDHGDDCIVLNPAAVVSDGRIRFLQARDRSRRGRRTHRRTTRHLSQTRFCRPVAFRSSAYGSRRPNPVARTWAPDLLGLGVRIDLGSGRFHPGICERCGPGRAAADQLTEFR